mmetsp:Transcript_127726/g.357620  ORF Transcript_127726/g.357620 Transcript_127726/m.357620 type:complete len:1173 (+) Transcript_127726:49-3567(+)
MPGKDGEPNPRSKPFSLTFCPCNEGEDPGPYKSKVLPINGGAVDVENAHFKGSIIVVHDTGNEPGVIARKDDHERRGVELHIQGKFKRCVEPGDPTTHGLWVGGDLAQPLKLGWIMQNIVQLCMKFARKKCEGRIQANVLGQVPHVSFPIAQLFTVIRTPPTEEAPKLGSDEMRNVKWQGAGWIDIDNESTYTLIFRSPYLDVCSWELLRVPGVSPLGFESILGDTSCCRVMIFDLGLAGGSYTEWKKGAVMQFAMSRGAPGDNWDFEEEVEDSQPAQTVKTVLDGDDASEGSDHGDDEDSVVAVEDQADAASDSSGDSDDSMDGSEEQEAMSVADSQALFECEGWRPRVIDMVDENTRARVPWYILAIDRRRKSQVRTWYVIALHDSNEVFWVAKDALELASLCRPKRRLRFFWRGSGARKCRAYTVKTLEQFRHVVRHHLASETKLRDVVIKDAAEEDFDADDSPKGDEDAAPSATRYTPAGIALKVRKSARRRRGAPSVPPRFFVGTGSACALAFAHAREGRATIARENIVGAIHFEGRISEELMRLSNDGTIRCFTPYDCEKPRIRMKAVDILHVQAMDGIFLGRFHLWQVHTILRVFVFCSHDPLERDAWVEDVQKAMGAAKALTLAPASGSTMIDIPSMRGDPSTKQDPSSRGESPAAKAADPAEPGEASPSTKIVGVASAADDKAPAVGSTETRRALIAQRLASVKDMPKAMNNTLQTKLQSVSATLRMSLALRDASNSDVALVLMDSSCARRWRSRRLVLNDRLVIVESTLQPSPNFAEELLESVLQLAGKPTTAEDIIAFSNLVCRLKAVCFKSWTQNELLAFWLNIYHCLLVHGWIILGRPNSPQEMRRFHNCVSYLVGLRPVSLAEIERLILRIPQADHTGTVKAHAGVRAQQLKDLFSVFMPWRSKRAEQPPGSPNGTSSPAPSNLSASSALRPQERTSAQVVGTCLPMMTIPRVPKPSWMPLSHHSCLFLGKEPEEIKLPKPDKRCLLCISRGTTSSLAEIAVFHANRLNLQLDDVARKFVAEFVTVVEKDGKPVRVDLPERCRALEQDLNFESKHVLTFLWSFMPADTPEPLPTTRVKYTKGVEEFRAKSDLRKLQHSDPNLSKDSFGGLPDVGAEFDAIANTAKQLARLASRNGSGANLDEFAGVLGDSSGTTLISL